MEKSGPGPTQSLETGSKLRTVAGSGPAVGLLLVVRPGTGQLRAVVVDAPALARGGVALHGLVGTVLLAAVRHVQLARRYPRLVGLMLRARAETTLTDID